MENFKPNNETPEQQSRESLLRKAASATSEEEIISIANEIIDLDLSLGLSPSVFIADLTNEGPSSEKAESATMAIAEKIKESYEAKGYTVEVERDPADFRDFIFKIEK